MGPQAPVTVQQGTLQTQTNQRKSSKELANKAGNHGIHCNSVIPHENPKLKAGLHYLSKINSVQSTKEQKAPLPVKAFV